MSPDVNVVTQLTFVTPPPGLAPLVDFILEPIAGAEGLYALQATQDPAKRMFVLDAGVYLHTYTPMLSDAQCAALSLTDPDDAQVLVVANTGEGATTVNLMAPIIVNRATDVCAQFILDGQDFSLRAPLGY
ncbi:MAG TPA: flagellar assembly protein FliW [Micrococcaceae bacterium]|jgi:flagellar assembly factor FliW|nr:flagellar assembly protein FliW [Micrococcaceae bacterium]